MLQSLPGDDTFKHSVTTNRRVSTRYTVYLSIDKQPERGGGLNAKSLTIQILFVLFVL